MATHPCPAVILLAVLPLAGAGPSGQGATPKAWSRIENRSKGDISLKLVAPSDTDLSPDGSLWIMEEGASAPPPLGYAKVNGKSNNTFTLAASKTYLFAAALKPSTDQTALSFTLISKYGDLAEDKVKVELERSPAKDALPRDRITVSTHVPTANRFAFNLAAYKHAKPSKEGDDPVPFLVIREHGDDREGGGGGISQPADDSTPTDQAPPVQAPTGTPKAPKGPDTPPPDSPPTDQATQDQPQTDQDPDTPTKDTPTPDPSSVP